MARPNLQLQLAHSPVLRYGLAVASFVIALGLALLAQRFGFHNVEIPLFLFSVAITAWYAGPGPVALALMLSIGFFDYFFTEPRYTLYVTRSDIPYLIVFISFALLVAWFSAVRRRVEGELRQARDDLQAEVVERTQQASLLT
jgi:K+-sensing histidine kinase KdpD